MEHHHARTICSDAQWPIFPAAVAVGRTCVARDSAVGIFRRPHMRIERGKHLSRIKRLRLRIKHWRETVNCSVWHQASRPKVVNRHRLGSCARGRGACFQDTKPSTPFRAEYPVQLQSFVYLSTGNRHPLQFSFFCSRCAKAAFLHYARYLERLCLPQ